MITRDEAIRILEDDHRELAGLLEGLTERDLVRPGIGSGSWTPTDLIGHVAFWEQGALDALDAWERGGVAPIHRALRQRGLDAVNAEAVTAARKLRPAEVLRRADRTHDALVQAFRRMRDDRWESPPTRRMRRTLSEKVGGILGGRAGLFTHAGDHIPELRAFIADGP